MAKKGKSKPKRQDVPGIVYILEFSCPMHHAKFYIGWCEQHRLRERVREHNAGYGARITEVGVQRGIQYKLIAAIPGTRADERALKAEKNTPRIVRRLAKEGKLLSENG